MKPGKIAATGGGAPAAAFPAGRRTPRPPHSHVQTQLSALLTKEALPGLGSPSPGVKAGILGELRVSRADTRGGGKALCTCSRAWPFSPGFGAGAQPRLRGGLPGVGRAPPSPLPARVALRPRPGRTVSESVLRWWKARAPKTKPGSSAVVLSPSMPARRPGPSSAEPRGGQRRRRNNGRAGRTGGRRQRRLVAAAGMAAALLRRDWRARNAPRRLAAAANVRARLPPCAAVARAAPEAVLGVATAAMAKCQSIRRSVNQPIKWHFPRQAPQAV